MEITHADHKKQEGIYAKSQPVASKEDWADATTIANEMIEWLKERNGHFRGTFSRAFAIAHAQVTLSARPWQLFVLDPQFLYEEKAPPKGKENYVNTFFEALAIFNCEVLEAPDKVTKKVPQRVVTKDPKDPTKVGVEVRLEEKVVDNIIKVPEACMSFPFRTEKNVERYYRIKVRYQWLGKGFFGRTKVETFEGWVEGLKAHIIQHETDHFNCKTIYH